MRLSESLRQLLEEHHMTGKLKEYLERGLKYLADHPEQDNIVVAAYDTSRRRMTGCFGGRQQSEIPRVAQVLNSKDDEAFRLFAEG